MDRVLCALARSPRPPAPPRPGPGLCGGPHPFPHGAPREPPPPRRSMLPPVLSPLGAAAALLLAVVLTAAMQLPAPGAIIVGIVIVLRSDAEGAYGVILDRLLAAFMGGAMAVAVWEIIWVAPALPVLAASVLFAAWLFSRRIAEGGPDANLAVKSLNVLAILIGEGFSVFYEDADDRFGTRLAGVMIGLAYVTIVMVLLPRRSGRMRWPEVQSRRAAIG